MPKDPLSISSWTDAMLLAPDAGPAAKRTTALATPTSILRMLSAMVIPPNLAGNSRVADVGSDDL